MFSGNMYAGMRSLSKKVTFIRNTHVKWVLLALLAVLLIVTILWVKQDWWRTSHEKAPQKTATKNVTAKNLRSSANSQYQAVLDNPKTDQQQKLQAELYFIAGEVGVGNYPVAAVMVESTMQSYPLAKTNMDFLTTAFRVNSVMQSKEKESFYAKLIQTQVNQGAKWPSGTQQEFINEVKSYAQ